MTFSAKCESDRRTREQLEKLVSNSDKGPTSVDPKKVQTGVIYIVLVIIGTAIVLLAIIVVLIVLIKQMKKNQGDDIDN